METAQETFAFIPHKDALFTLSQLQKKIITEFNGCHTKDEWLLPSYPLWAFCSEETEEKISCASECTILPPVYINSEQDGVKAAFPVEIKTISGTVTLNIVFATAKKIPAPFTDTGTLPLKQKSFRTGRVLLKDNSWSLFNDKWITCRTSLS